MKWQQANASDFNHQIKSGTASGSNEVRFFNKGWSNSDGFVIGASSTVGTEDISLQGDTLLNANVNMANLPTSSAGLSSAGFSSLKDSELNKLFSLAISSLLNMNYFFG